MNYLVDTNIWLERMLDQDRAAVVADLLSRIPSNELCMTDFTLHSIGVILHRLKKPQVYVQFVQDVLIEGATHLLTVLPEAMTELVNVVQKQGLDFDDAYQYIAAARYGLTIITLDSDFDRTDRGRTTPEEIIWALDSEEENE